MSSIQALNWRYATKKMNSNKKVQQDKVNQIIEAARLAPSSMGLQPFKILMVTNPELKEKIKAVAFDQSQITDCSHLLIFAAWDHYSEERIRSAFKRINLERGLPEDESQDNLNFILATFQKKTLEEQSIHAAKQAYISFGVAITEAALLNVDATPMEGFAPDKLDDLLGLKQLGLRSTTLLPLGYRAEDGDWLEKLKKVRTPLPEFIIEFN